MASNELQPKINNDVLHRINDINIMIHKLFHAFYSPHGLTYVQVPVLMALRRHGKMRVSDLGRSLEIGSSNITPLCKRLERANLVTRSRSNQDQRVVYVEITEHALEMLDKIEKQIGQYLPEISQARPEDHEVIMNGLNTLYALLENLGLITNDEVDYYDLGIQY